MEQFRKAKSGRRYDEGFKENAVSLLKAGRSFKEVARDLGVSDCHCARGAGHLGALA